MRQRRERGTEVNTRECIVCGERTGSVAILRIAPRRFCFRFRCPRSFSAPALHPRPPAAPPLRPFVSSGSLSRVLLSSGAHSYVKFGTARQREVMYDLTGRNGIPIALSLSLHKVGESGKNRGVRARAHSSSPHSAYPNVRHCSLIGRWPIDLRLFSLTWHFTCLSAVSFKFYVSRRCYAFFMDLRSTVLADGSSRHSVAKNANTH